MECCTCKRSYEIKKIQNGHFMSRKSYSTRWDDSQVLLYKSKQTAKFADFELQEMIDNYTKALKDLENSM